MKMRFLKSVNSILLTMLLASLFLIGLTSSVAVYDPWADINNDGTIDIFDAIMLANAFGGSGTPQTKAIVEFDSGWIDITYKAGQDIIVAHGLGSMDVMVDITGRTTVDGGVHQRQLGGEDYTETCNQTYGGIDYERGYSLVQTVDGGYALAGYTNSSGAGSYDFWLVKTDASGNALWNQTYGGTGEDLAWSVVQTDDDGYALAGITNSSGAGDYDFWLVKTDAAGNAEWNQTYGGTEWDDACSLVQTVDGGYALAGYTTSYSAEWWEADFWLVKTDAAGNALWNQTYGGISDEACYSMIVTGDGGYALAGYTSSYGVGGDFWLVKTDAAGNHVWNQTYGGIDYERGYSLVQTVDGGYALAGLTYSYGAGLSDVWLVKTDAGGNALWNRTYGGTDKEGAYSVVQTFDGGYALAGSTNSYGAGSYDFWLVKTDSYGNMLTGLFKYGLAWIDSTLNSITLYRGTHDSYWNYVRVRIWKIE